MSNAPTTTETATEIYARAKKAATGRRLDADAHEACRTAMAAKKAGDIRTGRRILFAWAAANPKPVRRSKDQITADRSAAYTEVAGHDGWVKATKLTARKSDLDALVKEGRVECMIRTEYDKQNGNYSSSHFGGAGVVQRKRAYYRAA